MQMQLCVTNSGKSYKFPINTLFVEFLGNPLLRLDLIFLRLDL